MQNVGRMVLEALNTFEFEVCVNVLVLSGTLKPPQKREIRKVYLFSSKIERII